MMIDIMVIPVVFYDIVDDDIHVNLNVFMIIKINYYYSIYKY